MNLDLTGKTAWVAGSTQGIGRAAANELARMGARIVLIARNEEKLRSVLAELNKIDSAAKHAYIVADFSEPDILAKRIESFSDKEVHVLVNNTGGPPGGQAINAEPGAFREAFEAHLICNHILTTACVPSMRQAGYGRIINVISTSVKAPLANLGVSNTIRGAVANWSKTLANELGVDGITVNNVLPGATQTGRLDAIVRNKAEKTGSTEASVLQGMANAVPMKRVAQPEEVANAIAFLASPAAGYINGVNLPVDGGRTPSL